MLRLKIKSFFFATQTTLFANFVHVKDNKLQSKLFYFFLIFNLILLYFILFIYLFIFCF